MKIQIPVSENLEFFSDEIRDFDKMAVDIDKLYDETYKVFDKRLQMSTGGQKTMMGGSGSDREVSEISKSLNAIKQTRINVTKEKTAIKKMARDLDIQEQRLKVDDAKNDFNEDMFRELMASASKNMRAVEMPVTNGNKGLDQLNNLDESKYKFTEQDRKMIKDFKSDAKGI